MRNSLERPTIRLVFPFCLFSLKPGADTGFQKRVSDSAESDSGLCPENPRPFEKGRRKLQLGVRWFFGEVEQTLQIIMCVE